MDVLVLIDKLDDLVHNAKPVPLTDQVRVDKEEIYDILDQMRATIPEEIKQARWIVKERQEMLAEAKREAERIVKEARERQDRLISEEEITKQAERAAELHRGGVDDPPARHVAAGRLDCLPQPDRSLRAALGLHRGAPGPGDRPRDPAAVAQLGIGRVGDRVDFELGDVRVEDLDHGSKATRPLPALPCRRAAHARAAPPR